MLALTVNKYLFSRGKTLFSIFLAEIVLQNYVAQYIVLCIMNAHYILGSGGFDDA